MAFHVQQVNKKTGVTYVYESTSSWDKEKKQSRNKQVCIGKLDLVSNEFMYPLQKVRYSDVKV